MLHFRGLKYITQIFAPVITKSKAKSIMDSDGFRDVTFFRD